MAPPATDGITMSYQKPVIGALSLESENCGCNFYVNDAGQGFYVYTEGRILPGGQGGGIGTPVGTVPVPAPELQANPGAIAHNNVAHVGDGSASVTPLANTGLPATQPIIFGVPIGATGIHANVGPSGSATSASVDTASLGISLLGVHIPLHL